MQQGRCIVTKDVATVPNKGNLRVAPFFARISPKILFESTKPCRSTPPQPPMTGREQSPESVPAPNPTATTHR